MSKFCLSTLSTGATSDQLDTLRVGRLVWWMFKTAHWLIREGATVENRLHFWEAAWIIQKEDRRRRKGSMKADVYRVAETAAIGQERRRGIPNSRSIEMYCGASPVVK
ncbi:hypothetical protein HO173_002939 [Letharia columbiana]|uniref:Uncharacterized protein n=1 Tax=Letharia columbiana TaxID=112416 RepID=A0A8H6G216_9LECA|nr:uncharacterized protein HO173_002939 [Letharia columbiana]KAF6239067.1 hypothetical protein HO173_002939 [Letharia columbiana]